MPTKFATSLRIATVAAGCLLFCHTPLQAQDDQQLKPAPVSCDGTLDANCPADTATDDTSPIQPDAVAPATLSAHHDLKSSTLLRQRASRKEEPEWKQRAQIKEEPPQPKSEFETFVHDSTGTWLPIFGASLFDSAGSSFAPPDHVPVTAEYVIGPADNIQLRIWGQINADADLTVDREGNIFIPQVGRVHVAGTQFANVKPLIRESVARVFRNFDLNVEMGDLRSIQVFVVGHARRPGSCTVTALSTLSNALFLCGGPAVDGSMRRIQVRRSGQTAVSFDLYDLLLHGDKMRDIPLQQGDVIFIPEAGDRIALGGSVQTPAIYEVEHGAKLREVMALAGGLSPVAVRDSALLQRVGGQSASLQAKSIGLDDSGMDTVLQNGDIVTFRHIVPSFDLSVSLKGNVADPVRLPWHDGMKISDLIPEKRALLTRDYWTARNQLLSGSGGHHDEHNADPAASIAAADVNAVDSATRHFEVKNTVLPAAADINWNYAVIDRMDPATLMTYLVAFNLGKAVLERDPANDVALLPGDVVTVFSVADFATPRAQQPRFVRIEGEVRMAGEYSVRPGETLKQLIARAGGLTPEAYVYGSEFTRESTRREQERALSGYIDQLQRDLDQTSLGLASKTISADQELQMRHSLEEQRASLERLRSLRANGRIVLDLKPESSADAFPDLPLENGDKLVIPSTPSTVSVVGTVYNQATFVRSDDMKVRDCLKEAGGPTRFADRGHMFVLRADGSVVSRAAKSKFEALTVYPGDAVVVPTDILKTSKMRSLMDWSQIITGFGLGAAAINVLK